MAKHNMLLGQARGKVGSLVFSRVNGQQIIRSKAESVKNPRTESQNVQRAIFATINAFASAVRDVVDHSFQSVKEGQTSVNRFVSINTKRMREAYLAGSPVDLMPKGEGLPYANAYRFSQGSLGLQRLFVGTYGTAGAQRFAVYQEEDWEGNVETAAQLQASIPAFKPGCEIAVIKVYYNEEDHYHYVTKDRAVFLTDFAGIEGDLVTANGINTAYLNMAKTTSTELLQVVGGNSGTKLLAVSEDITAVDGNMLVAACVIVSQQDAGGSWHYTTSDMVCNDGWSASHSLEDAVNSYGNAAASDITSTEYLQQSSTSDADAAVTIPISQTEARILFSGAAGDEVIITHSQSVNVNTEPGVVNFTFNMPKNGNVIKYNDISVRYYTSDEGGAVMNGDGTLKYSRSASGNTIVVTGTITPKNPDTPINGYLDILIIPGSSYRRVKFVAAEP